MKQLAETLADQLQLVGIVGIECFLTQDERVLINEIAPRTHNSGHYTIDTCETSQFEQQLRAISGLPLGATTLKCPQALMVNLLGLDATPAKHKQRLQRLKELPGAEVYWYEKAPQSRPQAGAHHPLSRRCRCPIGNDFPGGTSVVRQLGYGLFNAMPLFPC